MISPIPIPCNYIVSHWCTDPFTLGGWSVLTPYATINTRRILQEPIIVQVPVVEETNDLSSSLSSSNININVCNSNSNRIYLCGEYTNPTQAGMVHGAHIEGVRVANEIWEHFTEITATNDAENNNNNNINNNDVEDIHQQEKKHKQEQKKQCNVVIIGAGAAGLGCAYQIEQLNKSNDYNNNNKDTVTTKQSNFYISVTILEARDRIGGRVRTEEIDILQSTQQQDEQQQQQQQQQQEHAHTADPESYAGTTTSTSTRKTVAVELGANWLQQGYDNKNPLYTIACTRSSTTGSTSSSSNEELQLQVVPTNFLKPTVYPKHLQIISTTKSQLIMTQLMNRCKQYNDNTNFTTFTTCSTNNQHESKHQSRQQQQQSHHVLSPSLQHIIDEWFHEIDKNNTNNKNNQNTTIDTTSNNMYMKQEIQHILEGEVIIDTGVPLCNLSSTIGFEPGVGNGDYWIINGYKQIFNYFVQIILSNSANTILYNTPVTTIDSLSLLHNDTDSSKIVVTAAVQQQRQQQPFNTTNCDNAGTDTSPLLQEQQTFVTDIVVCCIPSAVLQRKNMSTTFNSNNSSNNNNNRNNTAQEVEEQQQQQQNGYITFIPPIPKRHQDSLDTIITGNVEKIVLCFTTRWWPSSYSDNGGYIRVHGGDYTTSINTTTTSSNSVSDDNHISNINLQQFGNVCEWLDCTDVYGYPVITGIFTGPWLTSIWSPGSSDYDVANKATTILYNAIFCKKK